MSTFASCTGSLLTILMTVMRRLAPAVAYECTVELHDLVVPCTVAVTVTSPAEVVVRLPLVSMVAPPPVAVQSQLFHTVALPVESSATAFSCSATVVCASPGFGVTSHEATSLDEVGVLQ